MLFRSVIGSVLILIAVTVLAQTKWDTTLYSHSISDSFRIEITYPKLFDSIEDHYTVLYYLDASLNMGKEIENYASHAEFSERMITVGISHVSSYSKARRRDFLMMKVKEASPNPDYAKAERFAVYLTDTIMHVVHKRLNRFTDQTAIIGHSFGGLFVTYLYLTRAYSSERFDSYIALSPSFWVNDYAIETYIDQDQFNDSTLYITYGGLEIMNKVIPSIQRFTALFPIEPKVYRYATHNSYLRKGIEDATRHLLSFRV